MMKPGTLRNQENRQKPEERIRRGEEKEISEINFINLI